MSEMTGRCWPLIPTPHTQVVDALTDLYKRLGEFDVMYGLWCRQSAVPDSKVSYLGFKV